MNKQTEIPDWETLLAHAALLQSKIPAAILALESIAGWHTHRRAKGKMVLGSVNKIAAGLRNQRRSAPLETTEIMIGDGRRLRLPTIEETLRIKTFLVVDRNAT
ncbi:MAG: hypothetical protein WBF89_21450 [Steroidobacteraceae bacterium]